ncbi:MULTISPECIES: class I SAM-dependent DNA methyltransferase [unclassified Sphingomonas]|jgi:SAM-dependent methyltransferase|uniref:class I SAM-dependent DNA methyltransferase n=1 Tax=unclassified Sphingomonas TaxID=196159 RepID=UPI0009E97087|nr:MULTISPECIES: class I SAM-dependent methyltransferase [unclassified Sphingomonas]
MSDVYYDHTANQIYHTVKGAKQALRTLFPGPFPASVVDFGCGTGTWLRACVDLGASDIVGVDASDIDEKLLLISRDKIIPTDLSKTIELHRRFDLVICLETIEHLSQPLSEVLIETLVAHGDCILFSAAAPGQGGEGHVNCQWPEYWQAIFNAHGFSCSEEPRWKIWDDGDIEPWYRQNIMIARRNAYGAGSEPRLRRVIHPDLMPSYFDSMSDVMLRKPQIFQERWWENPA